MLTEYVLGIHLLLPPELTRIIVRARKLANKALVGQYHNYDPHITLYLARYTPARYSKLVKYFTTSRPQACQVTFGQIQRWSSWRDWPFFILPVVRSPQLYQLHRVVLRPANQLRGNLIRSKDRKRILSGQHSRRTTNLIERYGYYQVLDGFHPHLSLGEIAAGVAAKALRIFTHEIDKLHSKHWKATSMVVGLYRFNPKTDGYYSHPTETSIELKAGRSKTQERQPIRSKIIGT